MRVFSFFLTCVLLFTGTTEASMNITVVYPSTVSLDQSSCGYPSSSQPLIVGGQPASPNEFPWIVNLRIGTNRFFCGGTLIDLDLVLTAAHCLYNNFIGAGSGTNPITSLYVYAGDHILNQVDPYEQSKSASNATIHGGYSSIRLVNDIALIKLSTPFTQTQYVRPISLPTKDRTRNNGKLALVVGWGATQWEGSASMTLRKVNVPLVTGSTCNNEMTDPSGSQLCAGGTGTDSCQGDSGGPIICDGAPDQICGIVSYGKGCACPNIPGIYTNVFAFSSWLSQWIEIPPTEKPDDFSSASDKLAVNGILLIITVWVFIKNLESV